MRGCRQQATQGAGVSGTLSRQQRLWGGGGLDRESRWREGAPPDAGTVQEPEVSWMILDSSSGVSSLQAGYPAGQRLPVPHLPWKTSPSMSGPRPDCTGAKSSEEHRAQGLAPSPRPPPHPGCPCCLRDARSTPRGQQTFLLLLLYAQWCLA